MLARIRKAKEENEGGFTLIELLVVVVIIGILAAIAIPTFLNQREKAWERAAASDARNAAVIMEEIYSDTGKYVPTGREGDFGASEDVTLTILGDDTSYCITSKHTNAVDAQVLSSANGVVTDGGACGTAGGGTGTASITVDHTPVPGPTD